MKANQKTLYRQIADQLLGKRHIPFMATDHEIGHGRDILWNLRAKEAPEHIKTNWHGTSWIAEVIATGTRDGKPFKATHRFITTCAPPQKPCCDCQESVGASRAGTGSMTPSSTRTTTATAATALE